jgi:hypothetical protein
MNWTWCGNKLSSCNVGYYPDLYVEGLREITKTSIRKVGVLAEISTGLLPNASQKCYHLNKLIRWCIVDLYVFVKDESILCKTANRVYRYCPQTRLEFSKGLFKFLQFISVESHKDLELHIFNWKCSSFFFLAYFTMLPVSGLYSVDQ